MVRRAGSPTILYGDSISFEARFQLATDHLAHHGYRLTVKAFPGTAPCDWLSQIRADLRAPVKPRLIALEFYGNNFTPCMNDLAVTDPAFLDKYEETLTKIRDAAVSKKVPVYWITPPPLHPSSPNPDLHDEIKAIADGLDFNIVNAGNAVADGSGNWVEFLPCLASEGVPQGCFGGVVKVRDNDLVHFYFDGAHDQYSGGVARWSNALVKALPAYDEDAECYVWTCPTP